jgi:glutamate-1-semialdehyde 2,1-aminomutase
MLHIMKDKAMLDPQNIRDIYRLCLKYPGVKLILAHCGRSFNALHAEGARFLKAVPNIWFDMSGICEMQAILPILKHFGPEKLLFGSDFPVSQIRGKCVSIGDGFIWLDENTCNWNKAWGKPILVGLESLGALQEAANNFGLDKSDVDLIFRGNGMELLGLNEEAKYTNQTYYRHAKKRIPGGTQLLSKRPENMAPNHWPPYFKKTSGCETWDLDGKHYYDFSTNAVGSCLLGYAPPEINKAITKRVHLGNMCSLNPPEEVALADKLCEIHPWADQARFVRGGGEACAVAVRIARASTGRNKIALCGYHGWQDWYLAANLGENDALKGHLLPGLNPEGVPDSLRNTAFPFKCNDLAAFQEIIDTHEGLAAVIMEPCRYKDPEPGFLEAIRTITRKKGIVLIMDEITVGWRLHFGGMHLKYNIEPDMAVFAKALGNGYPIGAVIGTKAAMEGANRSFISSTYWTESLGPVAALATIAEMEKLNIQKAIEKSGTMVQNNLKSLAADKNIPLKVKGFPALTSFSFDHPEGEILRTIFTQQMLSRGFLAGVAFYPTLAHNEKIISLYKDAVAETFEILGEVIKEKNFSKWLKGEKAHSGFSRLL